MAAFSSPTPKSIVGALTPVSQVMTNLERRGLGVKVREVIGVDPIP